MHQIQLPRHLRRRNTYVSSELICEIKIPSCKVLLYLQQTLPGTLLFQSPALCEGLEGLGVASGFSGTEFHRTVSLTKSTSRAESGFRKTGV